MSVHNPSEVPASPRSESRYPPPFPPSHPSPPLGRSFDPHMGKEKDRSRIDIILDAPYISLRGTSGSTVEPALLSGHVSLYLVEDTDVREVNLHFRGKAKIPVPTTESRPINSSMQSYIFCSHDWSFLESSCNSSISPSHTTISSGKRSLPHVRTLKAGRHIFPFTFTLTGNLPSTLTTHPLDLNACTFLTSARASITYKLRAVASRPGLSLGPGPLHNVHITPMMLHNLRCTTPVYVLRSLSPEALEFQLSTEIENTWPQKLMYAIMLPHRAWAAGDTLIAVLKLSPLAKGVWIDNVVTTLWETTELHIQQHHHLKNSLHLHHHGDKSKVVHNAARIVRCVKHKIVNGKAVRVDFVNLGVAKTNRGSNTPVAASTSRPGSATDQSSSGPTNGRASVDTLVPGPALAEEESRFTREEFENHDIVTYITFPIPYLATGPNSSAPTTPSLASPPSMIPGSTASTSTPPSPPLGSSSTYSYSPTPLPVSSGSPTTHSLNPFSSAAVNPTHTLPPIVVSHRIRWSFSIHNHDGHISELRCSLPIHILDGRVLSEAREASVLTRRMALVAEGLWSGEEDEENLGLGGGGMMGAGGGELNANGGDIFVDRELPSYRAHVRDRVASVHYSEMAPGRVPLANVAAGGEGTTTNSGDGNVEGGFSHAPSQSRPHSHQHQGSSRPASAPVLDQPREQRHLPRAPSASSSSSPLECVNSELMTLSSSNFRRRESNQNAAVDSPQTHSELNSRSGSPERHSGDNSGLSTVSDGHGQSTGGGHSVRNIVGLLKAMVKPLTALSHHRGNGGHALFKSSSAQDDHHPVPSSGPSSRRPRRASVPPVLPSRSSLLTSRPSTSRSHPSQPPLSASSIMYRSISEVPDYFVSSQGFMGGVPPLSGLMDLPSYQEAAREERT